MVSSILLLNSHSINPISKPTPSRRSWRARAHHAPLWRGSSLPSAEPKPWRHDFPILKSHGVKTMVKTMGLIYGYWGKVGLLGKLGHSGTCHHWVTIVPAFWKSHDSWLNLGSWFHDFPSTLVLNNVKYVKNILVGGWPTYHWLVIYC